MAKFEFHDLLCERLVSGSVIAKHAASAEGCRRKLERYLSMIMALIIYQPFHHRGGKVNCGLEIITSLLIIAHLKRTFPADAHLCTLWVVHIK